MEVPSFIALDKAMEIPKLHTF